MQRFARICLTMVLLASCLVSVARADRPLTLLFLGDQGHHQPAARARQLIPVLLHRGIQIEYTENVDDLNDETLAPYDGLILYANIDAITPSQEAALLRFVESGKGFVPIHCASYCFRNSEAFVKLVGAQFKSHGTGVFRTHIVAPDHSIMRGYESFESWDESYVHDKHNEAGRTVLEMRENEPYTWVRQQGKGRVFYTAWGHDERTWSNPGFQDLIERGIRWACGADDVVAAMKAAKTLDPFEYVKQDVAYYPPAGTPEDKKKWERMQKPLSPAESMKHMVVPGGFHVELFASEPDVKKPICMAWDERGRLWVVETLDYPNDIRPAGEGRDRITICEDTDHDGKADKFTVFADHLNIPTSLTFANGGVIVHQAPDTLFLRDTNGDDRADERRVLFTGWSKGDTHAGPSNLQYGFDNWIWGMQGYAGFNGDIGSERHEFRMGFYRFKPDGSKLEFIRSTNNNTWGLGFSEEGVIFGSTANNNPSVYMPIPNRYYDAVKDLKPKTLGGIADSARFLPITDKVRQVDVWGGYTAGAGHALYTARAFPQSFWNRAAFVNGPTGKLTGVFLIDRDGADYHSRNPFNLISSDDEWTAPICAEVGPDGAVWVIDWYNYIVQHNPTPKGYSTGPGNAYETDLRDKRHGRIYRVVYDHAPAYKPIDLHNASPDQLVATLRNDNLFWRRQAQRLLVERGKRDVVPALIDLVSSTDVDALGLNVGAIHALWTLDGLHALDGSDASALAAATAALRHPSAGVRRNAVQVLPHTPATIDAILAAKLLNDDDGQVRLMTLLALADAPASDAAGRAIFAMISEPRNGKDHWMREAATIAAVHHASGFLAAASNDASLKPADAADAVNLITNPSFEEVDAGKPVGWTPRTYTGQAQHALVEGGHTGKYALHIQSAGDGADTSWFTTVKLKPHTRYRLTGWVKTRDINNVANGLGVLFNIHELQSYKTNALKATNDWQPLQVDFDSENRSEVTINCLFGGWGRSVGEAWYDDLSVTELGPAMGSDLAGIVRMVRDQTGGPVADTTAKIDADTTVLELGTLENLMKYDKGVLSVRAGAKVRLIFTNNDHMQHNFLLIKPGTLEAVGAEADKMAADPKGLEKSYIPVSHDVIASMPLVDPGAKAVVDFVAPTEPGRYPYVCTFPGHWRIMQGVLIVKPTK